MLQTNLLLFLALSCTISLYMYTAVNFYYVRDYLMYLLEVDDPLPNDYFVVIGAGSAGCVVAGRLAEAGHKVILVEAGGQSPYLTHIPGLVAYNQLGPLDWQYKTEIQQDAAMAIGSRSYWPRGKVLGGTSMLNYMMYIRGHSKDYDEWQKLGIDGWNYSDVLPYFIKSEKYKGHILDEDADYHGTQGPLAVQNETFVEQHLQKVFLEAGQEKGYPISDPNGSGETKSFSPVQVSIEDGYRAGTYRSFAEHLAGGNIRVWTNSLVHKILFESQKAVGIEVERFGVLETIKTDKEIILSAGSIGTPQILMLSGVGNKDELQKLGIKTVLDLPEVGQNLQDHVFAPVPFQVPDGMSKDPFAQFSPFSVLDYLMKGKGPLTSNGGVVGTAFIHSSKSKDETRPDIQLIMFSYLYSFDEGQGLRHMMGIEDSAYDWIKNHSRSGITLLPVLSRPKSRGFIKLRTSNPHDHPIIQPNYLVNKDDLDTLAAAVQFAHELGDTDAFKQAGIKAFSPYPACAKHHEFRSEEYYSCYSRHWVQTLYHPVGTAAMGTVLDSRLRVLGLENLRVADGSAMPKLVGGNTNTPIIMIGERAASFINQDWKDLAELKVQDEKIKKDEL